jgi:predicted ATPase
MLSWEMRSHHMAREQPGPVYFDRGVPDVVGYLRSLRLPVPKHMGRAAETFRYARQVFVAPPWPEIFHQDFERKQSLDEAVRTYESLVKTYVGYGYELVEVPRLPVPERVRFVIENVVKVGAA